MSGVSGGGERARVCVISGGGGGALAPSLGKHKNQQANLEVAQRLRDVDALVVGREAHLVDVVGLCGFFGGGQCGCGCVGGRAGSKVLGPPLTIARRDGTGVRSRSSKFRTPPRESL